MEGGAGLAGAAGPLSPDEVAARLEPADTPLAEPAETTPLAEPADAEPLAEPAEIKLPADTLPSQTAMADAAAHLATLQRANRAIKVSIGGVERYAAVE